MRILRTSLLSLLAAGLAGGSTAAQDSPAQDPCAQLLPAIESLRAMLAKEAEVRASTADAQRMQIVLSLLALRYRNLEGLEASLRDAEAGEEDLRSAVVRSQAQIQAFDEETRNSAAPMPDAERKIQRAEMDANLKGLEERVKGIAERRGNYRAQLALERHDIDKLEALVRGWLEKSP